MRYSLFASDFDGTLLIDGEIPPGTREAVAAFRGAGGRFGICSGRDDASLSHAVEKAGLECDFLICLNGAQVLVDGRTVECRALEDGYTRCLPLLEERSVFYIIAAAGERVLWRSEGCPHIWGEPSMEEYLREITRGCALRGEPAELEGPALQISCRLPDAAQATALSEALRAMGFNACPNERYVDIMAPGVDKAGGIERICRHFGVPASRVAVIGDGQNDIPMLQKFHSFAMARAAETVRRQASATAHSVGEALGRIQEERA